MQFSLVLAGLAVGALTKFLDWTGIPFAPEKLETFLEVCGWIGAAVMVWWGRVRQGDVTWYGKKLK